MSPIPKLIELVDDLLVATDRQAVAWTERIPGTFLAKVADGLVGITNDSVIVMSGLGVLLGEWKFAGDPVFADLLQMIAAQIFRDNGGADMVDRMLADLADLSKGGPENEARQP